MYKPKSVTVIDKPNPLRRDNPPSFMTGGVAGSQMTLCHCVESEISP